MARKKDFMKEIINTVQPSPNTVLTVFELVPVKAGIIQYVVRVKDDDYKYCLYSKLPTLLVCTDLA